MTGQWSRVVIIYWPWKSPGYKAPSFTPVRGANGLWIRTGLLRKAKFYRCSQSDLTGKKINIKYAIIQKLGAVFFIIFNGIKLWLGIG
jgi:hypothetical protein